MYTRFAIGILSAPTSLYLGAPINRIFETKEYVILSSVHHSREIYNIGFRGKELQKSTLSKLSTIVSFIELIHCGH